jgi:hypothetical protein
MLLFITGKEKTRMVRMTITLLFVASFAAFAFCDYASAARATNKIHQMSFSSPEDGVGELVAAVKANDTQALKAIFGPGGSQIISSGDEVADRNLRERFLQLYGEKNQLREDGPDRRTLEVGTDDWPFPIPLVKAGGAWRFDTKAGKEEILNRRIGVNELRTIQTCLAYVDAQRDYATKDRTGDGLMEYAQKFASDPGRKNGLYWPAEAGEEQSPMGPLVAEAKQEGYTRKGTPDEPIPYHGYYFRILTAQGRHAPDGACDYLVNGKMLGGFALVAYPAEYGASGIMTFIVNHKGDVYEKDFGRKTPSLARTMKVFDPDGSWRKVDPKYLEPSVKAGDS